MSLVTSSANRVFSFTRRTEYLMTATTAAATMSASRSIPDGGAYVEVKVAGGTTGTGSVSVIGTDIDSSAATQTMTYSRNTTKVTTTKFASISSITTSGLADEATVAKVSATSVSADGTPNLIEYDVATGRWVAFTFRGQMDYPALNPGTVERDEALVLVDYEGSWEPQVDDIATDQQSSDTWLVRGVRQVALGFGIRPSHYQLRCTRYTT